MPRHLNTPFKPYAARYTDPSLVQGWLDSGMPATGAPPPWLPATEVLTAAFADTGGLISGDELVALLRGARSIDRPLPLSQAIAQVARWIVLRDALAFAGRSGWLLPLFQFDLAQGCVRPSMQPLLAELRDVFDDAELALWFVTPNAWLNQRRPVAMMQLELAAVMQAARVDRYVARGD